MQVFLKNNILYTKLRIYSTILQWIRDYEMIVDTGAFNTAIPENEIIKPFNGGTNLLFIGIHYATGVGFSGDLDMYEANLLVGEDMYEKCPIIAIPNRQFLLGREIISQYKWEIDYRAQSVKTIKN